MAAAEEAYIFSAAEEAYISSAAGEEVPGAVPPAVAAAARQSSLSAPAAVSAL